MVCFLGIVYVCVGGCRRGKKGERKKEGKKEKIERILAAIGLNNAHSQDAVAKRSNAARRLNLKPFDGRIQKINLRR